MPEKNQIDQLLERYESLKNENKTKEAFAALREATELGSGDAWCQLALYYNGYHEETIPGVYTAEDCLKLAEENHASPELLASVRKVVDSHQKITRTMRDVERRREKLFRALAITVQAIIAIAVLLLVIWGIRAAVRGIQTLIRNHAKSPIEISLSDSGSGTQTPLAATGPESWSNVVSIASGYNFVAALLSDGTVRVETAEDSFYSSQIDVSDWKKVKKIDAANGILLGLTKKGTVLAAGELYDWGEKISEWKNIQDVSTSGVHAVGARRDGKVEYAGFANDDTENPCSDWTDVVRVEAVVCSAMVETLGFRSDGSLANDNHQYLDASSSGWLSTAIRPDGSVYFWGIDAYPLQQELLLWQDIKQVCPGDVKAVGLKNDGRIVYAGESSDLSDCLNWTDVDKIFFFDDFSIDMEMGSLLVGIRKDGTVLTDGCVAVDTADWSDIVDVVAWQEGLVGLRRNGTLVTAPFGSWRDIDYDWDYEAYLAQLPPFCNGWLTFPSGGSVYIPNNFDSSSISYTEDYSGRHYSFYDSANDITLEFDEEYLGNLSWVKTRYIDEFHVEYYAEENGKELDCLTSLADWVQHSGPDSGSISNLSLSEQSLSYTVRRDGYVMYDEHQIRGDILYYLHLSYPADRESSCKSLVAVVPDTFLA